jgi:hypothetical protein
VPRVMPTSKRGDRGGVRQGRLQGNSSVPAGRRGGTFRLAASWQSPAVAFLDCRVPIETPADRESQTGLK